MKGLLKAGADINALDNHQRTPLYLACKENQLESAFELLKLGADAMQKDINGFKPVDVCLDSKVMQVLKKFEVKIN